MSPADQLISITLVLTAVCFLSSVAQRVTCTLENTGATYQDPNTPCSKDYEVCHSFLWRDNVCVTGHFNATIGRCQRNFGGSGCNIDDKAVYFPNKGRKRRDVSVSESSESSEHVHRSKRQSTDCSTAPAFPCPSNVKEIVVYPNFDFLGCTDFYLCLEGELKKFDCPTRNNLRFFYNPRTKSCEEYPGLTNTCVWRDVADYSPL